MQLKKEEAVIGAGATVVLYTDRQAHTIIAKTAQTITLQRDKVTRLTDPVIVPGGFAGHCTNNNDIEYSYEPDSNGSITKAHWSEKKQAYLVGGHLRVIEGRHEFYDYNF